MAIEFQLEKKPYEVMEGGVTIGYIWVNENDEVEYDHIERNGMTVMASDVLRLIADEMDKFQSARELKLMEERKKPEKKRTFMLSGEELPCHEKGVTRVTHDLLVGERRYGFKHLEDREIVGDAFRRLMDEAKDK